MSNYKFTHVANDPPALRFSYLNTLADHTVQKNSARNPESSLNNTLTTLRLTPFNLLLNCGVTFGAQDAHDSLAVVQDDWR